MNNESLQEASAIQHLESGPSKSPKPEVPLSKGRAAPRRISRTVVNFLLDATLLVVLLILAWVTALLRFIFPRPTVSAGWSLWGLGYDDWSQFQFVVVCVFLLGVLVHLMLHWTWICSVVSTRWPRPTGRKAPRTDDGIQTLYGVGTLIAIVNIVGLLLAAAALTIVAP